MTTGTSAGDEKKALPPPIAARSADPDQPVAAPALSATARFRAALSPHKWLAALAALALIASGYAIFDHLRGVPVTVERVQRADLLQTVVGSGHVESPYRVEIASQITGTVAAVVVEEGQVVEQGQPLILLRADELHDAADQSQAAVAEAQAMLRRVNELALPQALEARRSAQANLLGAQQIYNRAATLKAQGFVTTAYFDDVTRARDVARTQVATAEAQIRDAGAEGSGVAAAQADLALARAGAAAARSRLGYTTISAPRSGTLLGRSVERGSVVTPGAMLMLLSPGGAMQIVIQIDERNLNRIAVGQSARISADAYPQHHFAGTVSFINPGIDIARASATVKLTLIDPPAFLRENMTVSVDIVTARLPRALSLPSEVVRDAMTLAPWVMVMKSGRAARPHVRLGLQGNQRIQIIGGIGEGALIIPASADIAEGDRVRAAAP